MRTYFRNKTMFATVAMAVSVFSVAVGQEATRATEQDEKVAAKPRTVVEAIDANTAAVKDAADQAHADAEAQKAAVEASTEAMKAAVAKQAEAEDPQKPGDKAGDKDSKSTSKSGKPSWFEENWYWWAVPLGVGVFLGVAFVFVRRTNRSSSSTRASGPGSTSKITPIILLAIALGSSLMFAPMAEAACPAPFGVTSLSVVKDATLPEQPMRVMIMPDQTRKFVIRGCGFGYNEHDVVVGFTGGPAVNIVPPVKDNEIRITVKPDASFAAPQYLNLAVRVRGNLVQTPMTLEVQPPAAYAALQAAERHGVGTPSRPAPMVNHVADPVARATSAEARTAATTSMNASVAVAEKFERYFGKDGKGGSIGTEVFQLRKEMNELTNRVDNHDDDIADLDKRIKVLEQRGGGEVSRADFEALRNDVAALRSQVESYGAVKVGGGMFRRSKTIDERSKPIIRTPKKR